MRRWWVPVACLLIQLLVIRTGPPRWESGWVWGTFNAVGLALVLGLLWRHRAPELVVAVTSLGQVVQTIAVGPVIPAAVVVAVAALSRTAFTGNRPQPRSVLMVVLALVVVVGCSTLGGAVFLGPLAGASILAAVLVGVLQATRVQRELAVRNDGIVAERLRIARDLHDVVGHGVGAMVIQAGAARMAVAAGDLGVASAAMANVEAAGRGVMTEVRWLVTLLRDDSARPRLTDIASLVADARRAGLDLTLRITGEPGSAGVDVGEAAYRIVQEALTNVLRHSGSRAATVSLDLTHGVTLEVVDDGSGAQDFVEGNGVQGMRERAGAVGGRIQVGRRATGGWAVHADLPLTSVTR